MEGYLEVKSHNNISEMCFGWIPSPATSVKKEQWKRRYFVLQEAVSPRMPGQTATLIYYKDEKRKGKKGTIDLEHCEEVLSSLDSPIYPHLFGIKTLHKNRLSRTYYLAAHNEQDMIKWVDCLCTVLGLKENDDPPTPPLRPGPSLENLDSLNINKSPPLGSTNSLNSRPDIAPELPPQREPKPPFPSGHKAQSKEEYIPLDTCYSGEAPDDDDTVLNSIPMDMAPPPPVKTGEKYIGGMESSDETYDQPTKSYRPQKSQLDNNDNLYKLPPPSHVSILDAEPPEESGGSVYKFPPSRKIVNQQQVFNMVPPPKSNQFVDPSYNTNTNNQSSEDDDDVYKVPPPRFEQVEYDTPPPTKQKTAAPHHLVMTERDSNSSGTSKGSMGQTDDSGFCDNNQDNSSKHSMDNTVTASQEIYDIPPSASKTSLLNFVPPPPRPHKGAVDPKAESRYINLPSNSKSHPNQTTDKSYDFPVSTGSMPRKRPDAEMLGMSPPPPGDHKSNVVLHRYTNAPPGYIPKEKDSYMPMKSPTSPTGSGDSYLPMDGNGQNSRDSSYLPMDNNGGTGDSYLPMDKQVQSPLLPGKNTQDYLNMDNQDSYTPIAQQQLQRKDRGNNAFFPAIAEGGSDYGNRMSDIYSSPPSNRPISEEVYDLPPSNRPVESPSFNSYASHQPGRNNEVYALPPSNRPVPPPPGSSGSMLDAYPPAPSQIRDSTYDTPPPRPLQFKKAPTGSPRFKPKEKVPVPSFNVERSRSFKRNISPPKTDILLPKRKSRSDDSSSSDDDDISPESKSTSSHDRSLENIPPKSQIPHSLNKKGSLHRIPPPPIKKATELQYLELDLNSDNKHDYGSDPEKSPAACAKSPARTTMTSGTDYREIDFIKTYALTATKREVENKRKSSEKSVDE